MTRNDDRLDMLARDLAGRYGEAYLASCAIHPTAKLQTAYRGLGHQAWRSSQKHTFKPARLVKLGIGRAA